MNLNGCALRSVWLVAPLVCGIGSAASADIINESSDFGGAVSTPTAIPAFSLGSNTVSGSVNWSNGDLADYFQITLPSGTTLSSISLTVSNLVAQPDPAGNANHGFIYSASTIGPIAGGNAGMTLLFIPISTVLPVSLSASIFGNTAGASDANGQPFAAFSSFDYTWEFVVVPTPGAGALLGVAGLALARRRR